MTPVVVALPGSERLADAVAASMPADRAGVALKSFPDGETHVRLAGDVRGRDVVVACTLDRADAKLVPLALLAAAARDNGARRVVLAAPYLAYMRQDAVFESGDAVSSRAFGRLLSAAFDGVATVDPHLHRHASMSEVLSVPFQVVSSTGALAAWIRTHVGRPVIVGPDEESAQWALAVAQMVPAPHVVLRKVRNGDRDVVVEGASAVPPGRTPVIVDDIISTGRTLAQVVRALRSAGCEPPVALVVHAVFSDDAEPLLRAAGLARLVTSTTIPHATNGVHVIPALAHAAMRLLDAST